ncbi:hydrogenase maturation protease [Streptomyces chiangmaiensis]|uniref:Hydrogenase maturation protease n=1 Tax=Streptomyces chiangmaiensis TaxID=766497 RepID=A0ABU7FT40_9ACTN|nr:hydrogenase maturation protease [Streptomyces chiangmaiensis]MED7827276.1 hydrogenase maturation protease [Streptomyces chiangmaiensis]
MTASVDATVVGIGNEFRRDDGVGHSVIALLRERTMARPLPPGTVVQECDGDPGRLIALWEATGLTVVVDACFPSPACPGRIHRWCPAPDTLPGCAPSGRHSTHGLGLVETLHLARSLGRGPGRLIVYAVEGADRSLGTGLTPSVAQAVRPLAERIEEEVIRHAEAAPREPPAD